MSSWFDRLMSGEFNKFVTALLGAVSLAISEGLLSAEVNAWLNIIIAFLTSLGVYGVKNYNYYQGKREKGGG